MAGLAERFQALISLISVLAFIAATVAQSPPTSSGCSTSSISSLSPCLSYITNNVTTSSPPQSCCTALSSVVKTSAVCLCWLFSATNLLGIPLNNTRALALPGACKITAPPCKAAGPSNSPSTPRADSPSAGSHLSGTPPTGSVGGKSPSGEGSNNPTTNAAGSQFRTSRILSLLTGMTVFCIAW